MRSRALTETVQRPNVSVLVEEFRCQSHSISNQIGANASHRVWKTRTIGHGTDATESADTTCIGAVEPIQHIERVLRGVTMEVITDAGMGGLKGSVMGTQVCVKADGQQLYPDRGQIATGNAPVGNSAVVKPVTKGKLHDDWSRDWKFRSLYPAVGLVRAGEIWVPGTIPTDVPSQAGDAANFVQTRVLGGSKPLNTMHEVLIQSEQKRYPCVLTKQWPNGCFEVTAFKPDEWGTFKALEFPTMHKSCIFLTSTGENIALPETVVTLEVPKASPQNARVFIEGAFFVEHLGRVSPKPTAAARRVTLEVPKPIYLEVVEDAAKRIQQNVLGVPARPQEDPIQINVAAKVFEHFLSGEIRRGDLQASRMQKTWTIQLGPFATHKLRLLKKSQLSPIMCLYVDEEVLVECVSGDLGGDPNLWRCKFCFVGERNMDFNVFNETRNGVPRDDKSEVTKSYQYRHVVEVSYPHKAIDNLADATLTVDSVPFDRLPMIVDERQGDQTLSITRTALAAQFGLQIPKKVVPEDTRGTAHQIAASVVNQAGGWSAIGEAASKNLQDVGQNLSKLGLDAWSMMFLQRGVEAQVQPTGPAGSEPSSPAAGVSGGYLQPGLQPNPQVVSLGQPLWSTSL